MTVKSKIVNVKSDNLKMVRKMLLPLEGKTSDFYFKQIFQLFPKAVRVKNRFEAYDGMNNTFNLAYAVLKLKVYIYTPCRNEG